MSATSDVGSAGNQARFGVFELDLRSAELRREGVKVKLQEQPFRLLAILLEDPGSVVTREELRTRLWPSEFVDFDHSLNTAVRKLRAALDDSADNPRFIETVARRGYRFIAPVEKVVEPPPPRWRNSPAAGPAAAPLRLVIVAAALVLIVAAAAIFLARRPSPAPPPIDAVAVLPFTTDDPAAEHLSDGLTEIVIDRISRVPDIRVMARATVFEYKKKKIDPRRVGRDLAVRAVIVGDIRRRGDRHTVRVELIDVTDGTQLWGNRFESTAAELPTLQSRISDALTDELRQGISREKRLALARTYTRNPEAYDLYLKGLHAWNRRDPQSLRQSLEYYEKAIALDPQLAAAYSGLANTYGVLTGYGLIPAEEGASKVLATAQKALQLDPANAEAYTSLASTKFRNLWDFEGAERDYRRSLFLNPNYATGHQWYADFLQAMGRFEEAAREIDIARRLDPLSMPIKGAKCGYLYTSRRFREAVEFAATATPESIHVACILNSFLAMGDVDGLLEELGRHPQTRPIAQNAGEAYRRLGTRGFLERRIEELNNRRPDNDNLVELAQVYAYLGNRDQAFACLEKAVDRRVSRATGFHVHPAFDSLRADPRFDALARRIGIPPEAMRAADELRRRVPTRPLIAAPESTARR